MKILSYSLFCFIFCFLGLCDDDEEDCTKLEKEITVTIFSEMWADSDPSYHEACEYAYAIDFYKEHCGGDLSKTMSYLYQGCGQRTDDYTRVNWVPAGLWELTFTYEEDMLYVNVVDSRFSNKITKIDLTGKRIYEITDGGIHDLNITVLILDTRLMISPTYAKKN